MKIEINLKDLYPEISGCCGEGNCDVPSLEDSIMESIINSVTNLVLSRSRDAILNRVNERINAELSNTLEKRITDTINAKIMSTIETSKIKTKDGERKIEDVIISRFETEREWQVIEKHIQNFAQKCIPAIKDSYDNAFALHIVKELGRNKMLKNGYGE